MKKFAAILLLTIYSLTTLGIGVRQFYCCGKLKSTNITLLQDVKEKCGNSGAMQGCCKTTFKSLKIKDSHLSTAKLVTFSKTFTEFHLLQPSFEINALAHKPIVLANANHTPPPGTGVPLYILHCIYRI